MTSPPRRWNPATHKQCVTTNEWRRLHVAGTADQLGWLLLSLERDSASVRWIFWFVQSIETCPTTTIDVCATLASPPPQSSPFLMSTDFSDASPPPPPLNSPPDWTAWTAAQSCNPFQRRLSFWLRRQQLTARLSSPQANRSVYFVETLILRPYRSRTFTVLGLKSRLTI